MKEETLQELVLWQSSQVFALETCDCDFPVAWFPSWQLEQDPLTPAWLKEETTQELVL